MPRIDLTRREEEDRITKIRPDQRPGSNVALGEKQFGGPMIRLHGGGAAKPIYQKCAGKRYWDARLSADHVMGHYSRILLLATLGADIPIFRILAELVRPKASGSDDQLFRSWIEKARLVSTQQPNH